MENDKLKDEQHSLLFGVRRSVRYHNRRRMFFDRFHLTTSAVSIIFGSATILAVLSSSGKGYAVAAASLVIIMSAIDLVVGTSKMARLHSDLARRFIDLEKAIIMVNEKDLTEEKTSQFTGVRLDIEADEPPSLKVLDSICHNELLRAMGYKEHLLEISWWQRKLSQFIDLNEHNITTKSV